jgi:hypothetical protein
MATSSTYFLNAPSLASSTSVFDDDELSILAADGFYSDGIISREQVSGVLLPQQTCPSCVSYNCVEGICIDPGDGTGEYSTLEQCEFSCGEPPADTEIYFDSLVEDVVTMGVNNYASQTFDISIDYDMFALCDNEGTSGSDFVSATTTLYVSTNGGTTYSIAATITASVSGGNFPTPQFDNVSETDTYIITGVTNVSLVKVYATTDCDTGLNGKDGNVEVTLSSSIPTANVICNNFYTKTCSATTLTCTL